MEYRIINAIGIKIDYKRIEFSDGTHNVEILTEEQELRNCMNVTITVPAGLANGFDRVAWDLIVLVNALRYSYSGVKISLLMEYLPHARADRHFTPGSACPLKAFVSLVSSLNFHNVYVEAPHNATALPGAWAVTDSIIYTSLLKQAGSGTIVHPDKGAAERFSEVSKGRPRLYMDKTRDLNSGQVNGMKIVNQSEASGTDRFVILDDICDGGRTFIECAKIIKERWPNATVVLAVAHGIFSKGLDPLKGLIDEVYSYNIVGSYVTREDILAFNDSIVINHGE